jgi:hypothetical protein
MLFTNTKKHIHFYSILALSIVGIFLSSYVFSAGADNKSSTASKQVTQAKFLPLSDYTTVIGEDETKALAALTRIEKFADEASTAMLIEMVYQVPSRNVLEKLIALIEKKSGRVFDGDVNGLYEWLWSSERSVHPDYAAFKSFLYSSIDPRFSEYFDGKPKTLIRLDEVR